MYATERVHDSEIRYIIELLLSIPMAVSNRGRPACWWCCTAVPILLGEFHRTRLPAQARQRADGLTVGRHGCRASAV